MFHGSSLMSVQPSRVLRSLALCLALVGVLVSTLVNPVRGWGCTGHMLVAEIAQRHLSAANRAKSDALSSAFADSGPFPRSPDMVQIACWADDLKSWRQYAMKPWHYVDIPYNPDNLSIISSPYVGLAVVNENGEVSHTKTPTKRAKQVPSDFRLRAVTGSAAANALYAVPQPVFPHHIFLHVVDDDETGGNVVTAIRNMMVALKAHKVPIYSLTFAFANLLHFVGDVHQPLHATTQYSKRYPHGDRGGNSVKVKVDGVETNLHALWDNICLSARTHSLKRPLDDDTYDGLKLMADVLEDTYKFSADLISESLASAMAWESHMFAVNSSYPGVEEGEELSKAYLQQCRAVAEARVTLAGRRLGKILDEILSDMDLDSFYSNPQTVDAVPARRISKEEAGESAKHRHWLSSRRMPWWRLW